MQAVTQIEALMVVLVVGHVGGPQVQGERPAEVTVAEVRNSTVMVMAEAADPTMLVHRKSTKAESTKATEV